MSDAPPHPDLTAVIVARDEVDAIAATVRAAAACCARVLVVDTGSVDDTVTVAAAAGATVRRLAWRGYGATKNAAAALAPTPWVFSLDADERPDERLAREVRGLRLGGLPAGTVLGMRRITAVGGRYVRHGEWGRDRVWRIYRRDRVRWDEAHVHELLAGYTGRGLLAGELLHDSFADAAELAVKQRAYARLGAEALAEAGARATWTRRHLAPEWRRWRSLVLWGGWRDGRLGWEVACSLRDGVHEKYRLLAELTRERR